MSRTYQTVSFQVRIEEKVSIDDLAERIGKVFNCRFTSGRGDLFRDGEEVRVAETLGLFIELATDRDYTNKQPEGPWTYDLIGGVHERLIAEWPLELPDVSITTYVLQLLRSLDNEAWFDPS